MTPDQLDAVLPRVPAGIPALTGDLTDPEERAIAIRWLMEIYREADCAVGAAVFDPWRHRDPHGILDGDRWIVRNGRGVVVGSNDWPPPTHWAIPTRPSPPAPGITYWGKDDKR